MIAALARRLAVLALSLAVSTVAVFAFMAVLPGDPARVALGVNATDEAVAVLRTSFGLDRPLIVQYVSWVGGLVRGDLGTSYTSGDLIAPRLLDALAVTLWLVGSALLIAMVIAVPMGVLMAVRHRRADGALLSALSQVGIAIPAFLAGMLLVALVSVRLRWLPSSGWVPPAVDPVAFLQRLILPALSLGIVQAAVLARYVRSSVLDVLREDYLRTARSKGLTPARALLRHGLRNSGVPVVTVLGLQLSAMLVGAVVIERVFVINGLGSLLLDAVAVRDLIVVQDVVMVLVAIVLVVTFLTEVAYVLIDPRMRARTR